MSRGRLEHIPHPETTLREMQRVCRLAGRGVWTASNARSPYFWGGGGTGQIEETPRTLPEWRALLEANGWRIESVGWDPGPLDSPARGIDSRLKRLGSRMFNHLSLTLTYQFVIHARPICPT